MPTVEQLDNFYTDFFWQNRGKVKGIKLRDIDHYILKENIPEYSHKKLTILNFGAGVAGISRLFWLDGHDIVNDPADIPFGYDERWLNIRYMNMMEK